MVDFIDPKIAQLDLEIYMKEAILEAEEAGRAGELPIGAVLVLEGEIISRGRRLKGRIQHAELTALLRCDDRLLTDKSQSKRMILFTTVEPCPMCLGAVVMANIPHIIFALHDKVVCSSQTVETNPYFQPRIKTYHGGVLEEESAAIIGKYMPEALRYIQTGY